MDDLLKHSTDQQTIGLILCETKNKVFAEYALRDIHKPIGVSEYELTRALPVNLKGSLPTIEEIEAELSKEEKSVKKEHRKFNVSNHNMKFITKKSSGQSR